MARRTQARLAEVREALGVAIQEAWLQVEEASRTLAHCYRVSAGWPALDPPHINEESGLPHKR